MKPPSRIISRDDILPFPVTRTHASNTIPWLREPVDARIIQIMPRSNPEAFVIDTKEKCNWLRVHKSMWFVATLGRFSSVYKTQKYISDSIPTDIATHSDYVSITDSQWEQVLQDLKKEWKISGLGCALIMPLSIALLQLDSVFDDILGRTAAIAAFIFSVAGLVLGSSFVLSIRQFKGGKCQHEWVKASRSLNDVESIEFWSLLVFPMSLLIWSVILCVTTVLILAWNIQDGSLLSDSVLGSARARNIISATFLTALAMVVAALMCRCGQISRRLL